MERELVFVTDIDEESAKDFMVQFWELDQESGPITIRMCSGGGEEDPGWAMFDTIQCAKNDTHIIAYGQVSSMALLVLQAGTRRTLSPNCRLLLHDGTGASVKNPASHIVISLGREQEYGNSKYADALNQRSKLTYERIRQMCKEETYFSSMQALDWGLTDDILGIPKRNKP